MLSWQQIREEEEKKPNDVDSMGSNAKHLCGWNMPLNNFPPHLGDVNIYNPKSLPHNPA